MDEVKYTLIAEVNDEVVFQSSYPDLTMLEEEMYKAERQVQRAVEENLIDDEEDED